MKLKFSDSYEQIIQKLKIENDHVKISVLIFILFEKVLEILHEYKKFDDI